MKKALALALALLLGLCLAGCGREESVALIAADSCVQAAKTLATEAEKTVVAQADTDRAALEQLSAGGCEFAIVREKSLRDALTGGDSYHGRALDNLFRLDNLLLGAFCVFSNAGQAEFWTEDTEIFVLQDEGTGEALAAQITSALQLSNARVLDREEISELTKKNEQVVVMGLFVPGEELIDLLVEQECALVEAPVKLTAPSGERSMAASLLPVLYDGMPRQETLCLYGALVSAEEVDENKRSAMLSASAQSPCHLQQLPELSMDGQ